MSVNKTILLVTDFSYQARGREYSREDVELSQLLRKYFKVYISHIADTEKVLDVVDAVLLRNTGPQTSHDQQLAHLRKRKDLALFNDLNGKGDIEGKQHLRELFQLGYPVIPTFTSKEEMIKYGFFEHYLIKPLDGADSHGVKVLSHEQLFTEQFQNALIQPLIDFEYEVSFYFVGREFHYSLFAPNPQKRWEMVPYIPSREEIDFAVKFIDWNTCQFGVQRVDACRSKEGELLLMELEDYNPFLSLNLVQHPLKERFVEALSSSIEELINSKR
jgi:hypothetical protein